MNETRRGAGQDGANGHLLAEQWDELLAGGAADAEAWEHLEACAECREELAEMRGALRAFAMGSLEEAERRAAERVSPAAVRAAAMRRAPAEPAWWATAAAALVAVVLFGSMHVREGAVPARTAAGAVPAENKAQIAEDNKLMSNIDAELKWEQGGAVQMPAGSLRGSAE